MLSNVIQGRSFWFPAEISIIAVSIYPHTPGQFQSSSFVFILFTKKELKLQLNSETDIELFEKQIMKPRINIVIRLMRT